LVVQTHLHLQDQEIEIITAKGTRESREGKVVRLNHLEEEEQEEEIGHIPDRHHRQEIVEATRKGHKSTFRREIAGLSQEVGEKKERGLISSQMLELLRQVGNKALLEATTLYINQRTV